MTDQQAQIRTLNAAEARSRLFVRLSVAGGVVLIALILALCGFAYYAGVSEAQKDPELQKCESLDGAWKKGRCYLPDGTVIEDLGNMNGSTGNGEGR